MLNDCQVDSWETFADRSPVASPPPRLTATEVHQRHGELVWQTLHRMGVRAPHVEDVYQEVFLVVHRRLDSFVGHCPLTAWLYEVCFRVVAGYRRRAYRRRELLVSDAGEVLVAGASPERDLQQREAVQQLQVILSELKLEHRVVFSMFELEELTCVEIGQLLGVPLGTVYSRLHRARRAFERALERSRCEVRSCFG
jgi:RNA polymerase sigma-70 factor, ECF subfamily